MPLQSLLLRIPAALADAFSDALLEAGAQAVTIEDAQAGTVDERPIFGEPGGAPAPAWEMNVLQALIDAGDDPEAMVQRAAQACGATGSSLVWQLGEVPDEDWVRRTQSQFQPIQVDSGLWIVPSWHEPADPAAINIRLDPGLAFGTGSHPTTRLCLRYLRARLQPGMSVLDYGCGSGILAIAAARLGASPVLGTDIDPDALAAARDNARRNIAAVTFAGPGELPAGTFDIVVANILANPLRLLAPALAARVRPAGRIALAGILEPQAAELCDRYAEHFEMSVFAAEEGWVCLEGCRGADKERR